MPTRISCLIPCEWRAASATSALRGRQRADRLLGLVECARDDQPEQEPDRTGEPEEVDRHAERARDVACVQPVDAGAHRRRDDDREQEQGDQDLQVPDRERTRDHGDGDEGRDEGLAGDVAHRRGCLQRRRLCKRIAAPSRTPVRTIEWSIDGCGRARRSRRAGAQPQGHHRPAAPERADLHHRPVRVGQVQPGLRHDLRGRAAPLRRVAVRLRAAVPPDDGETRRRLDRRALAGDLDRPEDDLAEPALDGRHGDRDLRLPAAALRARRSAALPDLRPPDRRAVDRGDRRPGAPAAGGDEVHGQRAGRPRPQGRAQGRLRAPACRGLHPGEGRRGAASARRGDRSRQEVQAHDRGGRRPAGDEGGPAYAAGAVDRDSSRARRGAGRDRRRGRRGADLLGALRLSRARCLAARAPAADLLVQLAARSLPAVHRPGCAAGDRPRPARPRPVAVDRRGRARAVVGRQLQLLRVGDPGDRRALGDRPRQAVAGALERPAGPVPVRHQGRAHLRPVPQPDGAQALVHAQLRGHRPEPRTALPRDRLVAAARADRGVHVVPALPGVRRRPAEARGAGGHGRRPQHPRVHEDVGDALARVPRRARADRGRAADRRADRQGDPRAADVPRRRRRRVSEPRPWVGDALGRRGAAAPAGDPDRLAARGRPLHPRRAVDRPPPARQRQADRHARAAPRPRQHRGRRRARRADDALGRLARRHGAGGGRARRPRRRGGDGRRRCSGRGGRSRGSSSRARGRSRCRSGGRRISDPSPCAARRSTT